MIRRTRITPYLFVGPAAVAIILFRVIPIVIALGGSLFAFQLIGREREFVGLDNFFEVVSDTAVLNALWNTIVFTAGVTATQVVLSLLLGIVVSRETRGIAFFRTLMLVPVVTSMVVAGAIWKLAYNADSGMFNAILSGLGVPRQPFLTSPGQAMAAVMVMVIWKGVGYWMAVFVAGIKGIPIALYEAARIDGAGSVAQFRHVTLPLLRRSIAFVVVADTAINFLLFAPVYLMTRGGPSNTTSVLMYETYKTAFVQGRMGYAAALAVVLLTVSAIVIAIQLRAFRSNLEY